MCSDMRGVGHFWREVPEIGAGRLESRTFFCLLGQARYSSSLTVTVGLARIDLLAELEGKPSMRSGRSKNGCEERLRLALAGYLHLGPEFRGIQRRFGLSLNQNELSY
jgi:hypothetical protein